MNKDRRKRIEILIKELHKHVGELEMLIDEEQEAYDNLPEGLQYSLRGESMEEAIDTMSEALDSLNDTINSLEEVT